MRADVIITDGEYRDVDIEAEIFGAAGLTMARLPAGKDVCSVEWTQALLVQYAPITADVFAALPSVRVVSRYGTGYDNVDVAAATAAGVWVANVPVYGTDEVAIHTFSLMLSAARGQSYYDGARRRGDWPPAAVLAPHPRHLAVGVLGAGRIGRRVIELAGTVFGTVRWFDLNVTERIDGSQRASSLDELLMTSNILSIHLPLSEATQHLIGGRELGRLREPRIIVNAARGAIVDQDALAQALADGTLWAAGLDVLEHEPARPDGPLVASDRVILSPHAAWASEDAVVDVRRRAAQNIVDALTLGHPTTPVNDVRRDS